MLTASLSLIVTLATAAAPATEPVAVYVSAPTRDGFVDTTRVIQDSVDDVRAKLGRMKEFRIVTQPEDADLVLTVVARGIGAEAFGQRVEFRKYYENAELESVPIVAKTYGVSSVLTVGNYRKELAGRSTNTFRDSMGAWNDCAKQVADDLQPWTVANAAQLARRPR